MKGNKIIAILVVLAMVLSTMIVLNTLDVKFVEKAGAVVGVTEFGYPTNVTTKDIVYDPLTEVDITVNTTGLAIDTYYLYYPYYDRPGGGTAYNLTWKPYMVSSSHKSIVVSTPGVAVDLTDVKLNRSGLWVLNSSILGAVIDCSNLSNFNNTVDKWFWVNTSSTYTVHPDSGELYYAKNVTFNVAVRDEGGSLVESWLDVRRDNASEAVISGFPALEPSGAFDFETNWLTTFKWTGNYTVFGWVDADDAKTPLYQHLEYGYNDTFGSSDITADYYDYSVCGPWDPPEYNTTRKTIYVQPGEPICDIPEANATMYWSFDGEVNISIIGYDDENLSDSLEVKVFNPDGEDVTANLTIDNSTVTSGYLHISNGTWGKNGTHVFGENGTWEAYLYNNTDNDAGASEYTEEWNITVDWEVKKAPGLQFKWKNDDGNTASSGTSNDGVIEAVPDLATQPLNITFQLISDSHGYYGNGGTVATKGENITISGDALFTGTLDKLPGVYLHTAGTTSTWCVPLIPLMNTNGGEITISANWKDEGTITETLTVGGSGLNGSIVTISPTEFIIDQNVTLTVTVTDPIGHPYPNANVFLYWVNDSGGLQGVIDQTSGDGTTSGEYEFHFNTTQQTTNQTGTGPWATIMAPRNISAYVDLGNVGKGYALATMKPQSDLKVTAEASASASTTTLMAGKQYSKIWFNTTVVDSVGNLTGYPADTDLKVRIYNETGIDVTGDAAISSLSTTDTDGDDNKTATNEYFLKAGTYTVHAYNNTHNSEGNNATLVVKAVDVTCTKEEFIWKFDKNTTAIFTVKYNGELINGTLKLYNITDVGDYNRTWVNESGASNDSIALDIVNGVATLSNITAEYLPGSKAQENITFMFELDASGAQFAKTNGFIPVKIPSVATSPETIPFDKKTPVKITITGRGILLEGVFVSIFVPGLAEQNGSTDALGEKDFAFTPPQTGNVVIQIENRTSDTVIKVTSWSLYIYVPTAADESGTFVVTVRNETINGDVIEGATITFNRETYTTGSDGTATINSPTDVAVDSDFTVTAAKEGYAPASDTINIINKPRLEITIDQTAGDDGKYSSPVDVYVSDDDGNLITAATVTFGTQVLTTINGKVAITVTEETVGTIGATKTGFTPADGVSVTLKSAGIPGFELLTLIAAIGVAFILLRRRRH